MADIKYISEFLTKVEGPRQTRGYIPSFRKSGGTANYRGDDNPDDYTAMGASGVTIATGCDLGQTSLNTLWEYGVVDKTLLANLAPYISLKQRRALNKLHERPLTIAKAQAEELDRAVHKGYLDKHVRPGFERDSAAIFDELPKQAQAVIMSMCFQKGIKGVRQDWPVVWGHLVKCNWAKASDELQHGFTQYKTRRAIEGRLLVELL